MKDIKHKERQETSKKFSNLQTLIESCSYPNDHKAFVLEFI